jgi:hypothetical protein
VSPCLRNRRIQTCTDSVVVTQSLDHRGRGRPCTAFVGISRGSEVGPAVTGYRLLRLPIALSSVYLGPSCAGDCQTGVNCLHFNLLWRTISDASDAARRCCNYHDRMHAGNPPHRTAYGLPIRWFVLAGALIVKDLLLRHVGSVGGSILRIWPILRGVTRRNAGDFVVLAKPVPAGKVTNR